MKKLITFLMLIIAVNNLQSCNLCWGYPKKGPRLRQVPIQKIACNCECYNYPHTKGDNNFYVCTNCSHRITPPEINPKKGTEGNKYAYKYWSNKTK